MKHLLVLSGVFLFLSLSLLGCKLKTQEEEEREKKIKKYFEETRKKREEAALQFQQAQAAERLSQEKKMKALQKDRQVAFEEEQEKIQEDIRQVETTYFDLPQDPWENLDLNTTATLQWETQLSLAFEKAKEQKKASLFLFFTDPSSAICQTFEQSTLSNAFLVQQITKYFIPVRLEGEFSSFKLAGTASFFPLNAKNLPVLRLISVEHLEVNEVFLENYQGIPETVQFLKEQVQFLQRLQKDSQKWLKLLQDHPLDPKVLFPYAHFLERSTLRKQACSFYHKALEVTESSFEYEEDYSQALECFLNQEEEAGLEKGLSLFEKNYPDSSRQAEFHYRIGKFFWSREALEKATSYFKRGLLYGDPSGQWHQRIRAHLNS
jgi:hypothetical protein